MNSCNRCPYSVCLPEVVDDFVEGNAAEYTNNEAREKVKHGSLLTGGSFVIFRCNNTRILVLAGLLYVWWVLSKGYPARIFAIH